ncbi:MAG: GAF domain-containing protein, partial [Bacteroidetes bacterium]
HSLLMSENSLPECSRKEHSYYVQALQTRSPLIVDDLNTCTVCTGFEEHLRRQHLRNLVIAPLWYEDRLLGLLELASPRPGAINALNVALLDDVITLLATAMKRSLEEQEDRVQALIKKHYTAIHPTVEWRFRQAALRFMEQREATGHAELEPIVFPDVYPLYGLSDIRDSSTIRNAAIQADLIEQLGMALGIIVEASAHRPLPALDELGYRLSKHIDELVAGLHPGNETMLFNFLHEDVESLFDQLATFGESVRKRIEAYRTALDPTLGILYQQRRDFEESVMLINETISNYLDRQEEHAQAMFPHYFEKYKTDGVDYNIYIGASLVENHTFDRLYLRNLRLWQLMTMCGIVWEMERLHPQLRLPLETAHLILVQDQPLSIRFRQDEKRFDVDGAYNIRYEIVKKRIDKARVRGTDERLTQPGKLAIVYGQPSEAEEYLRYIDYLQSSGYLTGAVEHLELENLQGVYGLKALRVSVAEEEPEFEVSFTLPDDVAAPLPEASGDGAAGVPAS